MSLSHEQKQQVADWIKQKCPNLACPGCGHRSFGSGEVAALAAAAPPYALPVLPVLCKTCGHVMLFSAAAVGI
jgi:hypothetical protein